MICTFSSVILYIRCEEIELRESVQGVPYLMGCTVSKPRGPSSTQATLTKAYAVPLCFPPDYSPNLKRSPKKHQKRVARTYVP